MFRNKLYLIVLILFVSAVHPVLANPQSQMSGNPAIQAAIDLIFQENFRRVESKLDSMLLMAPDDPATCFYRGVSYWRESYLQADFQTFDTEMQKWLEKCLEITEKRLTINPEDALACFYKGGAHGFLGTMYARQQNWLKTGYHAWKGIHALEKALEIKPDLYDVYYGLGLYHAMAGNQGAIVRFLQRLLPIPTGNSATGISSLKFAIQKGVYSPLPASSALAFAYLYFENDYPKAIQLAESLLTHYPENLDLLSTEINARFNLELSQPANQWAKLVANIDQLDAVVNRKKLVISPWWSSKMKFMRAYAYYHLGKYESALSLFEAYSRISFKKGSYLSGLGALTCGKIYDLMGKRQEAIQKYKNSQQQEKNGNVAELAENFLKNPFKKELKSHQVIANFTELPNRP
jgi:tetratricopeptide (TPR) repeat protein